MLLDVVKQMVAKYGAQILSDPAMAKAFLLESAKGEPKFQKAAFIECLEYGAVKMLTDAAEGERANCKEVLAQKLYAEERRDITLYREAADILCEMLFAKAPAKVEPAKANVVAKGDLQIEGLKKAPPPPENTVSELPVISWHELGPVKTSDTVAGFKDPRDGVVYRTVKIGSQVWMAENLCYKVDGSWCYGDDEANVKKYGRLYTWSAAKAACPAGWRLPARQDWDRLVITVGGSGTAGKKLKAASGWKCTINRDGDGTDRYGFSALPGGYRGYGSGGFYYIGEGGSWWTSTELDANYACCRDMHCNNDCVNDGNNYKSSGLSVRCIKE
ncbi:hypothetical protein R80B4_03303 [Fibrobacteres bacterium R8-0-B4]